MVFGRGAPEQTFATSPKFFRPSGGEARLTSI
jgi:hypothetical protein